MSSRLLGCIVARQQSLLLIETLLLFGLQQSQIFVGNFGRLAIFIQIGGFPIRMPPKQFSHPLFSDKSYLIGFRIYFIIYPFGY